MSILKRMIEEDFGLERIGDGWYRAIEHDSLVYNEKEDLFYWNSEDFGGNAYTYLLRVRGLSKKGALKALRRKSVEDLEEGTRKIDKPSEYVVNILHENLINNPDAMEYFNKRGVYKESIAKHKLGFFRNSFGDFYSIPLFDKDGKLSNIQIRTERDENGKKTVFKFYKIGRHSIWNERVLFESRFVYFTEGLVDAVLLDSYWIPVISTDGGLSFGDYIIERVETSGVQQIFVVQDNDKAGMKEASRLLNVFGKDRVKILSWTLLSDIYGMKVDEKEDVISLYQKYGSSAIRAITSERVFV